MDELFVESPQRGAYHRASASSHRFSIGGAPSITPPSGLDWALVLRRRRLPHLCRGSLFAWSPGRL